MISTDYEWEGLDEEIQKPDRLVVTRINLQDPDLIEQVIGKINSEPFEEYEPGSLLLVTCDKQPLFTSIEYIFRFQRVDPYTSSEFHSMFDFNRIQ